MHNVIWNCSETIMKPTIFTTFCIWTWSSFKETLWLLLGGKWNIIRVYLPSLPISRSYLVLDLQYTTTSYQYTFCMPHAAINSCLWVQSYTLLCFAVIQNNIFQFALSFKTTWVHDLSRSLSLICVPLFIHCSNLISQHHSETFQSLSHDFFVKTESYWMQSLLTGASLGTQ